VLHAESGDSIASGVSPDCHGLEEIELLTGGGRVRGSQMCPGMAWRVV
jgi:hypothetical protein